MEEKAAFFLEQMNEGTIFTIVGTYGKPFLKLKTGYASMTDGAFTNDVGSVDEPIMCKPLDEITLAHKYSKSVTWISAWKEHITHIANK